MNRRYRIGIIGAGHRAAAFAPQLYQTTARAELFGLCDIDADRLQAFVQNGEYANARTFTNVDEFLAQPELDAVIVTVPEFAHAQVTCQALHAGKPIYLEKPIAHTLEDAQRLLETQRQTGGLVYVGFNLRAAAGYHKMREIIRSGVLGQLIHIEGVEQLHHQHIARFMRRFHRKTSLNGGLLNAKCCHDLDMLMWLVGHERPIARVSSFGGCSIFQAHKQPASHCRNCPTEVYRHCVYRAPDSENIRLGRTQPMHSNSPDLYPGDLCVYTPDKDIVDNQTVILEWEDGLRGNFNLQAFQNIGRRTNRIWGERGLLDFDEHRDPNIRLTCSASGDTQTFTFVPRQGGHGGADAQMIDRFLDAIEQGHPGDSGLEQGYAATLLALKADESRISRTTIEIAPQQYAI